MSLYSLPAKADEVEKNIFMLSVPIKQSTKLNKILAATPALVSAAYTSSAVAGTYHLSHGNLKATAIMAAYQYIGEIPALTVQYRALLEAKGRWDQYSELQKIANIEHIDKIHIFTTGYANYVGIIPSGLSSSSVIFIESEKKNIPAIAGAEWIQIRDPQKSTAHLKLKIDGQQVGSSIEIPLKDFLAGAELNPETRKEWGRSIVAWKKTQPFLERFVIQKKFSKNVSISGSLFMNEEEIAFDEIAAGRGTQKIIKPGLLSKAISQAKYLLKLDKNPNPKLVRSIDVLAESDKNQSCTGLFRRLAQGNLVRKRAP